MAMLKDEESSVSAPWKTLFNANPAHVGAHNAPSPVRENRVTGLYVKTGIKKSLRGKSSSGTGIKDFQPLSTTAHIKDGPEAFPEGKQLQDKVDLLVSERRWQELANALCDLQTIRKFVCHPSADEGILKILQLFNKACSALEMTAKQALDEGEVPPSAEYLERMRQHRRFILDHSTVFARRPQALLEKALFVSNTLPLVARNASEMVQGGDQMIRSMKEKLKNICSTSTTNVRAAAELAVLKAQVREISLMGSMQNAFCPAAIAARYRLTVARIGKRIIQTRKTLLESGISVDEATLKEIILRDEGVYPSSFDESLAQQAIEEAKKALENLEKALDSAQAEKNQQKKQQMDAAANAKAEENELKAISEAERSRDVAKSETSYRNIQVMRSSLCEEIWTRDCISRGAASLGGALCVDDSRVFVSCDDTAIQVFELDTLLFDFVKTYTLDGHAKTVICLATCDKNILFSGSLDCNIIVWNLEKMTQSQVLVGHTSHVTCLAVADEPTLSRDGVGKSLCSGSLDMTIKIWKGEFDESSLERVPTAGTGDSHFSPVAQWVCMRTLIGHGCYVHSIVSDGSTLYSAGEDGLIKIWSVDLKHSVGQLEGCQDSLYALCIDTQPTPSHGTEPKPRGSDGRKVLVSAGIELNMKGWDLDCQNIAQDGIGTVEDSVVLDLSPMAEVLAVQDEVEALKKAVENAVTPEGRTILSDNLSQMKEKAEHETRRSESFQFVKSLVCENGLLYSAGGEDVVRIWSLELGACVGHIDEVGKGVYSLAASQDFLAVCCADKKLRVFGSADSQKRFEENLEARETKFLNEGGELWALDLLTGAARMFMPKVRISMMACGKNHGLLLDNHGYVWAWGESDKGQNGLGHQQSSKTPKRIEKLAGVQGEQAVESLRMKQIAAGDEHSLLLTHGGSVWVCGANMSGQLGMQETEESKTLWNEMQLVTQAIDNLESRDSVGMHEEDQSKGRLQEKLKEVQTAWEMAHYVYIPTHNSVMKELRIVNLAAGKEHSVFVDDLGIAHTCGLAEHGQLGLAPAVFVDRHDGVKVVRIPYAVNEPFKEPKSREATIKIVNAACGDAHTVFLSEEGRAYSCGSNSHGQLGIGKKPDGLSGNEMMASIVTSLKEFALTQVAAGAQHSLFLTRSGEVYSCGNAEYGALGHGKMPKTPSLFVPRRIAGLTAPGSPVPLEVRHISASPYTSYFATSKGRSFYCGLKIPPPPESPNKSARRRSVIAGDAALLAAVDVPKRIEAPEHIGHVAIGPATNVGTLSTTASDQEIIMVVDSACVPFHPFHRIGSTSGRNSPSDGIRSMRGSPSMSPKPPEDRDRPRNASVSGERRPSASSTTSECRVSVSPEHELPSPPRMVPFPGVVPDKMRS